MNRSIKKSVFLALAVIGLVATWYHIIPYTIDGGGFSVNEFLSDVYANRASAAVGNDILVVCALFFFWSFLEAKRLKMKSWWIYAVLTFAVALAVSFPLFMYMRERAFESRESTDA